MKKLILSALVFGFALQANANPLREDSARGQEFACASGVAIGSAAGGGALMYGITTPIVGVTFGVTAASGSITGAANCNVAIQIREDAGRAMVTDLRERSDLLTLAINESKKYDPSLDDATIVKNILLLQIGE